MSFIDIYFASSYDDYAAYFGEYKYSQYRYVLINNDLSETFLVKNNPAGWDDLEIKFIRNEFYHTVLRSFAMSLRFHDTADGGGTYIREQYLTKGIDPDLEIEIWERNSQTDDYDLTYSGKLDFKPGKFLDEVYKSFIQIGIMDGGKENKFLTRDKLNLDVFEDVSVDGDTVAAMSNIPYSILYKKIDIKITYEWLHAFKNTYKYASNQDIYHPIYKDDTEYGVNEIGDDLTIKDLTEFQSKEYTDTWTFSDRSGTPGTGEITKSSTSPLPILISKNSQSQNWDTEIDNIQIGDFISIREDTDPTRYILSQIVSEPVDQGTYYSIEVGSFATTDSTNPIRVGYDVTVNWVTNQPNQDFYIYTNNLDSTIVLNLKSAENIVQNNTYSVYDTGTDTILVLIMQYVLKNSDGVQLQVYPLDGQIITVTGDPIGSTSPTVYDLTLDLSNQEKNITMEPGDTLELGVIIYPQSVNSLSMWYEFNFNTEFDWKITEIFESIQDSDVNTVLSHDLIFRLIQLTTNELDTSKVLRSEILGSQYTNYESYTTDGDASLIGFTNGKLIRGYPDPPLNLSVRDVFKSLDACFHLCLGFDRENDRFFIEKREQAYDNNYFMFDLGEVSEFTSEPMSEAYFNQINAGWPSASYEEIKGANEINVEAEYSETREVKETYDIRSKINGDSTGQELARRKPYSTNASEDTRQDDNNYMIDTDGSETLQGTTGVEGYEGIEQAYNLRLTPRKNLKRHGGTLLASLFRSESDIKFVKRQKKSELSYTEYGTPINENDDVTQSELSLDGYTSIFKPDIYRFKAPINQEIIQILNVNANGYFRLTFRGITYEAFINEVKTVDYPLDGEWIAVAKWPTIGINKIFEDDQNHITEDETNRIIET